MLGNVLRCLLAAGLAASWSRLSAAAQVEQDGHCAMQVGNVRRKVVDDFGGDLGGNGGKAAASGLDVFDAADTSEVSEVTEESESATVADADVSAASGGVVSDLSGAGSAEKAAQKHAGHGNGKWAQTHEKVEAAHKHGAWAGKKGSKKTTSDGAEPTDYVHEMIDRFLLKSPPPKNQDVSDHTPLVFMHQHRTGGTTMRKLLYNVSINMKLKPHIMCAGEVDCREFKNHDSKAAVYGGQFCWSEMMESLTDKQVSCLTNFREPVARIQSCYTHRLVHTKKIAPACMGKLEAPKLKSLLVNYGCVNEPFRRLGHCGLQTSADADDRKARMRTWNATLEHLATCVPLLVDKPETFGAAVKYFPQFKQVFWQMKKMKLNENEYAEDCEIPSSHLAVMKELASQEELLYQAAHKRAVNLNHHAGSLSSAPLAPSAPSAPSDPSADLDTEG